MKKFNLEKDNTLLLMIDIQERLAPAMNNKEKTIANVKTLLTAFRELSLPVIHTEQYPKGLGATLADLSELTNTDAFEKIQFSAYTEEIKSAIFKSGKMNILIIGMETHVCVYQTVRSLLEAGYNVFVIRDCVASRTEENYENALDMMKDMGAVITNMETVLFDILKKAGSPEFKIISKLIK
ncbi:MAG: isochorismatase family protein [Tissierellia bacterium]|nr:isochorismatase family protein [Tissierellia bacterium]